MKLRAGPLVMLLALALFAAPRAAAAQRAGGVARIGLLLPGNVTAREYLIDPLRQGLRDHGWVEGRNLVIEARSAEGEPHRFPGLAAELVRLKVDVLLTGSTGATSAARRATTTIPIVMVNVADPVGSGFVASLARPGGNITGFSSRREGFPGKWLELIKEAVPQASRVAVHVNPGDPPAGGLLRELRAAAERFKVELHPLEVREEGELDAAFDAWAEGGADTLIVLPSAFLFGRETRLRDLAATHRIPAIYPFVEFARRGGLMAYAPNIRDSYRRASTYVDKVLKGAQPADLPVQDPVKFELVINLKTAKALGLAIPPSLLIRADEVIE